MSTRKHGIFYAFSKAWSNSYGHFCDFSLVTELNI